MPHRLRVKFAGIYRLIGDAVQFSVGSLAATLSRTINTASEWIVGTQTFTQGSGSSDISTTLPAGVTTGGTFSVDLTGTQLPGGMNLTTAGVLTPGTATPQTVTGVVFEYAEPGALPTLTLYPSSAGTVPYMATVYPLEGVVPASRTIVSTDDTSLRCSILSTWPDGSAQVCVVAGSYTFPSTSSVNIGLRVGNPSGTDLTTSAITAAVQTVTVSFGGGPQTLTLTTTNHDWIWWKNPQVICARYRTNCGRGSMEAVIDVHVFASGRAFVEVMIENGKMDCGAANVTALRPATQSYTNATVAVNGTTIATVSSPTTLMSVPIRPHDGYTAAVYSGGHEAFRAWYCAAEVSGGTVTTKTGSHHTLFGVEVTHDTASLQAHPWFFKPAETSTQVMSTKYGQSYDVYTPWALGRLRVPAMGGGGDDQQIAFLTEEQADYIITADRYARRAVLASGTAQLSLNSSFRHTDGRLPTRTQMTGKATNLNFLWPETLTSAESAANSEAPQWDRNGAHLPATTLVAFLCRPSPYFIEQAQKTFCWHATTYGSSLDAATHWEDEVRSRGWRLRDYGMAAFLTPDTDYDGTGRKDSLRAAIFANVAVHNQFFNRAFNELKVMYANGNNEFAKIGLADIGTTGQMYRMKWFMSSHVLVSWLPIERVKVLRGTDQQAWTTMCDQFCDWPIRAINQSISGEWRAIPYNLNLGLALADRSIDMASYGGADFGAHKRASYAGSPPAATGPWLYDENETPVANWSDFQVSNSAGIGYDSVFWAAFCTAVERGGTDADTAWDKVVTNGGLTGFSTWRQGFRTAPRFNRYPRNKP